MRLVLILKPNQFFNQPAKANTYFQTYTNSAVASQSVKTIVLLLIACVAIVLNVIEIFCYIAIFVHLTVFNKNVASFVLKSSVIQDRNRTNAINLTGQFAGWLMEVWYTVLAGILSNVYKIDMLREAIPILKLFDFVLIPLVQIYTSPPIKRFMMNQ